MWQTKYALAVTKNLGLEFNFRPCSEGYFLSRCPQSVYNSMTSVLAHRAAQPTKCRFLPQKLNKLNIFVHLIMSRQKSPKFKFQSQFSVSKNNLIILIYFLVDQESNFYQYHFLITTFFEIPSLFSKIGPYICRLIIK